MNKININSNITINWKIWRGVNKVEEDFVGSNLRVFLIGTENTYYLVPKAEGGVLTMTIAQGSLASGSYDLKAIWEINGGRTLMSSTRSNIFGITENEAPERTEVINIVSYVESYGRDGLSAFEIAVLRDLHRGCTSEAEWIESLYVGGEGGGSGICTLGIAIPIGGTELGDELLDNEEVKPYVSNNTLIKDTPLNVLFKALLYRAVEIQVPENVETHDGFVTVADGQLVITTSEYIGKRPNGYVEVYIDYRNDNQPVGTPHSVTGLEYGYATDAAGLNKVVGEDSSEAIGEDPEILPRSGNSVTLVTVDNGAAVTFENGAYRFSPKVGNNIIRVEYNQGAIRYTIEELHVWPLNSAENVYSEDGVKLDAVDAEIECKVINGSHTYPHPEPKGTNFVKTQGGITFDATQSKILITNKTEANVGEMASCGVLAVYGYERVTNSSIKNQGEENYGYKPSESSTNIAYVDIEREAVTETITQGSYKVEHNTLGELTLEDGKYSFVVQDGENIITATLTQPSIKCDIDAIRTVYTLNEDGEVDKELMTTKVEDTVTDVDKKDIWKFSKELSSKIRYFNGTSYVDKDIAYNITPAKGTPQRNEGINLSEGASDSPFYMVFPASLDVGSIKSYTWDDDENKYITVATTFKESADLNVGEKFKEVKCDDPFMAAGWYYFTIIK